MKRSDAAMFVRAIGKATKRVFAKRLDHEALAELVAELESRVAALERQIAELLRQRGEDA